MFHALDYYCDARVRLRHTYGGGVMDEYLECDCCGGDAAMFPVRAGDPLLCGCSGSVICDEGHLLMVYNIAS